eukprot:c18293_g1_i4.p1 GENE.c18293_g1_i4~~c18293_g1_i4.p1  ORF type:complete len:315 (-),score=55.00 c18293_g1_i4:4-948(-)
MDAVNDDYVKSNGAEIFIIGFSRGAFTARSLVSVVRKCGIGNYEKLSTYYKDSEGSKGDLMKRFLRDVDEMYQIDDKKRAWLPKSDDAQKFRKATSVEIDRQEEATGEGPSCKIQFLGVFDTVGSMGMNPEFTGPGQEWFKWFDKVRFGFHNEQLTKLVHYARHAVSIDEHRRAFKPLIWKPHKLVDSKQVCFCGDHSDIGGGNPNPIVSDIPLLWMASEARAAGLHSPGLDALIADRKSALKLCPVDNVPIHGQPNRESWWWWLMWSPMGFAVRKLDPTRERADLGFHPSVAVRMAGDPSYRPYNSDPFNVLE